LEPLAELSLKITSLVWAIHELDPKAESLSELLSIKWREKLQARAEKDYSAVQTIRELADETTPSSFAVGDTDDAKRAAAIQPVLSRLEQRVACLKEELGKDGSLNLKPAITRNPKLLTREELYEKVLTCVLHFETKNDFASLCRLAKQFIGSCQDAGFLLGKVLDRSATQFTKSDGKRNEKAKEWLKLTDAEKQCRLLNRLELRKICEDLDSPVPFSMVLSDELDEIAKSRLSRVLGDDPGCKSASEARKLAGVPSVLGVPAKQAFDSNLFGLALSGGGIRSATFALGLLQGMADRNILPYVDVLSTVSGGGYIGSWLISWIKRTGSVASVQQSLQGSATPPSFVQNHPNHSESALVEPTERVTRNSDPHFDHVRPVRLLRDYARFLAPQAGLFAADTWTIVATWGRNTILNLMTLALLFGALLLTPRIPVFILSILCSAKLMPVWPGNFFWSALIAAFPMFLACLRIRSWSLNKFGDYSNRSRKVDEQRFPDVSRGDNDSEFVRWVLPLLTLSGFLEVAVLLHYADPRTPGTPHDLIFACFLLITLVGSMLLLFPSTKWRINDTLNILVAWLLSGVVGAVPLLGAFRLVALFAKSQNESIWLAASLGITVWLGSLALAVIILLGLLGNKLPEEHREWWSRAGAWLMLLTGSWLIFSCLCFFLPPLAALLATKLATLPAQIAAGLAWVSVTGAGLKMAFDAKSGIEPGQSGQRPFRTFILNAAPSVFVVGSLAIVSCVLFCVVSAYEVGAGSFSTILKQLLSPKSDAAQISFETLRTHLYPESTAPIIFLIVFGIACAVLAWRVDINQFSMHNFYKNRLVRAYLGTSRLRGHRYPNAFTGFDEEDDIPLGRFSTNDGSKQRDVFTDCKASYSGPFPIINTALNLTRGEDLGMQERKAVSFAFTPLWSGFDFSRRQIAAKGTLLSEFAYRRTCRFGTADESGVLLGTAMAISGAAFNSNAGFHTSPSLAFLLTVFGVRLGWWGGNPRKKSWRRPSPLFGLFYLIFELTANTTLDRNFVLLSDGGHFENMGLYELIRRRCRYIIVSDAEEDEHFKLEGIGGAIRKCRDDFGVVINLEMESLRPLGNPAHSRLHFSIGSIWYPEESEAGTLIYIKASVTNDEPVDVAEFRKRHAEFPHTSTANQFFDESHFESYRELGHHVAEGIFTSNMKPLPVKTSTDAADEVEKLFDKIKKRYHLLMATEDNQSARAHSA
jgi:hypothetical protein